MAARNADHPPVGHGRPRYGPIKRLIKGWRYRPVKTSPALRFYNEVLGLDYLHYGLWDGDPPTLAGLRAAQERYAELLVSWVPDGVRTVIDVGCGTGGMSLKLRDRGYQVEGLAPDPYQQRVYTERTGLPFHLDRLHTFEPKREYDLALMSESSQYTWVERVFPSTKRFVSNGYVLVADYFVRVKDETRVTRSGHLLERFLAEAGRNGFALIREEEITDRVTPTLDLGRGWVEHYGEPSLRIVSDKFAERYPRLHWLGHRVLRKQLRRLNENLDQLDSAQFKRLKRYMVLLFKVGTPPDISS